MENPEIIERFRRPCRRFEREAIEAAVARPAEIIPDLLRHLEDDLDRAETIARDPDYLGHLYAMFLLAQFRETRAYPLIVRYANLPGNLPEALGGNFNVENLSRVLASVYSGDLAGIQSIIENKEADPWTRNAALDTLVTLVVHGNESRETIIDYFSSLFRGKLERQYSMLWDFLVGYCADLGASELLEDIAQAYDEDLVSNAFAPLDWIREKTAQFTGTTTDIIFSRSEHALIDNIVEEMGWWTCFDENDYDLAPPAKPFIPEYFEIARPKTHKVGRNEPCPCGSGRKYKKCCGYD